MRRKVYKRVVIEDFRSKIVNACGSVDEWYWNYVRPRTTLSRSNLTVYWHDGIPARPVIDNRTGGAVLLPDILKEALEAAEADARAEGK